MRSCNGLQPSVAGVVVDLFFASVMVFFVVEDTASSNQQGTVHHADPF
jgi:hypothetical protein